MVINRAWAMPNKSTFHIKPVHSLIDRTFSEKLFMQSISACDPFVGKSQFAHRCLFTNDLDPEINASHHNDALDFLKEISTASIDLMLFDPPYSPRQVSESYKKFGKSVNMQTTQASYWSNLKREISRVVKKEGCCITFGWNSGGIGQSYGFSITEVLLVAHGGWHNDTICTVEARR